MPKLWDIQAVPQDNSTAQYFSADDFPKLGERSYFSRAESRLKLGLVAAGSPVTIMNSEEVRYMTGGKGIPFLDLITPHAELEDELLEAVKHVLTSGMFIGGPVVEQFEREFAQF